MAQKLTKALVESLPFSTDGNQATVMDTTTPGFGIRIGSQSKTFIVVKRTPHGTPKRVTLGKYGPLTVEAARRMAMEVLSQLTQGQNINEERRAEKQVAKQAESYDSQTLRWLFNEYKTERLIKENGGSEGSLQSMGDCFAMFGERECQTLKFDEKKKVWMPAKVVKLESWLERPLRSIEPEEILARFEVMEVTRPQKLIGGILAPMKRTHQVGYKFGQGAFEFFIPRNYVNTKKQELLENPFKILSTFNKWKAVGKKTRIVDFQDESEFGTWWNAVQQYRSVVEVAADYIEFSLLQGGRSIEIVNLTWDVIDMKRKVVTYVKTKNKEDYKVPLSNRAYEILKRRLDKNPKGNKWVWNFEDSKTGHIPKDTKHHFHKLEEYGAKYVTTHDLKRTYASAANTLREYNEREIDYLLKHKHAGVNEHYFVRNEPLLREIIQKVEDKFLGIVAEFNLKKAA